jgi:mRNA interferase MazF
MRRGEIWRTSLGDPQGAEPGVRRPVVIVSPAAFDASRIGTIIARVIAFNVHLAAAPGNFRIAKRDSGLPRDSVVAVSQIITIDQQFLGERHMRQLENGLRLALTL